MPSYSASIVIRRPVDEVYAFMDDIEREQEWQPNLRSWEQIPPGPVRTGTRKRYVTEFLGRKLTNTYVVRELEPGVRVVQETERGSSADVTSEVRWAAVPGGTRVTITVEARPSGLLRLVPGAILESATRAELEASLERLRACLESE